MASSDTSLELVAGAARRLRTATDQDSRSGSAGLQLDEAVRAIVTDVVAGGLAECCLLELTSEGSRETRLVAVAHRDPAEVERVRAAHGRGAAAPQDDDEGDSPLAAALGWSSSIAVPLTTRGVALGILTIGGGSSLGAGARDQARLLAALLTGAFETAYLLAERDELLNVVSHDLRNPLGVILLVVDLLRGAELPDELTAQMSRLERASQTMSRIITDLVDVGRLGTPSVPLEPTLVSAAAALVDASAAAADAAEARRVTFERSVDPALEINADGARLARVLDLLVSGAVQRTPVGGSVAVSAVREADRVVWSVADGAPALSSDSGMTHSAAIRRRTGAFTWMFMRGVVRAHGGTAWLDESEGRVALRFALPLAAASALAPARGQR